MFKLTHWHWPSVVKKEGFMSSFVLPSNANHRCLTLILVSPPFFPPTRQDFIRNRHSLLNLDGHLMWLWQCFNNECTVNFIFKHWHGRKVNHQKADCSQVKLLQYFTILLKVLCDGCDVFFFLANHKLYPLLCTTFQEDVGWNLKS